MFRFALRGVPGGDHHGAGATATFTTAEFCACEAGLPKVVEEGCFGGDVGEEGTGAVEVEEEGGFVGGEGEGGGGVFAIELLVVVAIACWSVGGKEEGRGEIM